MSTPSETTTHVRGIGGELSAGVVERGAPIVPCRAERHRIIVVEAFASASAPFVGMAEEERIFGHRVAMQVDDLHVAAVVEDLLGAVAMVIVDVEDR